MITGRIDRTLLLITLVLSIIGIVVVYSSTSIAPQTGVQSFYYLKRHFLTFLLGMILLLVFTNLGINLIRSMAIPLLVLSLILLLLVFTDLGVTAGGARRWIRLWPTVFQPSELAKLALVLFISWYMSRPGFIPNRLKDLIPPVVVMGIFQLIFIKQPDFGAFLTLGIIVLGMLFLSGIRLRYIAFLTVVLIPVVYYLIKEPYRWRRVTAFLDPWQDPTGSGFQLVQSLIAFGSGGLTGVGLGESKQKLLYLPSIHNDFIFSLIGEELGFIGASTVVLLFLWLFIRGTSIASRTNDPFSYYLASGISLMIGVQALVNFAVATGLAPTKGLPLPFVSYGGSSLVVNMMAVGMLLNISRNSEYTVIPWWRSNSKRRADIGIEKKKAFVRRFRVKGYPS